MSIKAAAPSSATGGKRLSVVAPDGPFRLWALIVRPPLS